MRSVSTFSGIGGVDEGFRRAGIETTALVEINGHCVKVLERRFPGVPKYNDVRTVGDELGPTDILSGGFPCQDLSVAGKRAGLAGERSGLFHEFRRIADLLAPRWLLLENVPGLLSSNEGADFAVVLGGLTGYEPAVPVDGWRTGGVCVGPVRSAAWRVLDSRYFGVAQRRRRVFVVVHARAERAVAVLFEPESCGGDPAPRRAAGQDVAGPIGAGSADGRGRRDDLETSGAFIPQVSHALRAAPNDPMREDAATYIPSVAYSLRASSSKQNGSPKRGDVTLVTSYALRSDAASRDGVAKTPSPDAEGKVRLRDAGFTVEHELAPTADAAGAAHIVAQTLTSGTAAAGRRREDDVNLVANTLKHTDGHDGEDGTGRQPALVLKMREGVAIDSKGEPAGKGPLIGEELSFTLSQGGSEQTLFEHATVRRLTPTEYERLQGFPDGWTCLEDWTAERPYSQDACRCPDSPRYAACGNAVTVNVAEWIGRRIVDVDARP